MPNWEVYAGWVGRPDRIVYQRKCDRVAWLIQMACPEDQMDGRTGHL